MVETKRTGRWLKERVWEGNVPTRGGVNHVRVRVRESPHLEVRVEIWRSDRQGRFQKGNDP